MSEAATPAAPAQPAAPAATPASVPEVKTVVLSAEEHAQLVRQASRAASAQSKLDRYEAAEGRANGSRFKGVAPAKTPEPSKDDAEDQGIIEDRKAERGLMSVAMDPAFRDVLDADPTLRQMFTVNPLSVLPLLAPDALDAEDAILLVKGKLTERAQTLKKPAAPTPEQPKPATPPAQNVPPAGGVNTTHTEVDEAYEAAKKIPNTERAIAGMVGAGLKKLGMKKN